MYNRFTSLRKHFSGPGSLVDVSSEREATISTNTINQRIVLAILLMTVLFYAWLASYSREKESGRTTYYYSYLSQAFAQGNLHLPLQPDPGLLALENPYDLAARVELEKKGVVTPVDFSLYKGKFHLYWGPVPALVLSVLPVFSQQTQPIADFFLTFLFAAGILFAHTFLLTAVWRRYFSALPVWTFYISLLLAGLIWPAALLRHEHNHARIYEAAIAAGQFFLICGLWMAFSAIQKPSIPGWRLALAGFLWALAIGSRQLLLLPIAFMVILTAFWIFQAPTKNITSIIKLLWLTLPLAVGGVLLAWYNWARFDSLTETGFSYALAGVDLSNHLSELFSRSYVIPNMFNYLLNPPHWIPSFPFVAMLNGNAGPGLSFYYAEPMTGLLYMFPFAAFALVPFIFFLLKYFITGQTRNPVAENDQRPLHWIILGLSGSFLVSFFLLMTFFWAGMRYAADFLPALTMLSSIGFWQGYQRLDQKFPARNYYGVAGMILAGISIAISTLLALSTV